MDRKRSTSVSYHPRFDKQLFEARPWSLRRRCRMIATQPHDLRYTVVVLRLLWVVVVLPFLTAAACAFLLGR